MNNIAVTIWIAARNEQNHILACLQAVEASDFPKNQMQVLIGNDHSDDETRAIVLSFIADKPNYQLIDIDGHINNQRGKGNVLAQLYPHSKGKYFLITDADARIPITWISFLYETFEKNLAVGHLVGITTIIGNKWWQHLQALDWLLALTQIKKVADLHIPLTGLGNNMAVSRTAYETTGGYAKIPFSITEDQALVFACTHQQGFSFIHLINKNVLVKSFPMETLSDFFHQRKRWMIGAMRCPIWVLLFLFLQALVLPCCILLASSHQYFWGFSIWFIASLVQVFSMSGTLLKLKQTHLIKYIIIYPLYANLWQLALIFYYFLPISVNWKGRTYQSKD